MQFYIVGESNPILTHTQKIGQRILLVDVLINFDDTQFIDLSTMSGGGTICNTISQGLLHNANTNKTKILIQMSQYYHWLLYDNMSKIY